MKSLLVGTAGTGTSWGIIRSIQEQGFDCELVAADMSTASTLAAAQVCERFVQMPPISDPEFKSHLLEELQSVDAYWPTHDPEMLLAAQLEQAGQMPVLRMGASLRAVEVCSDKQLCSDWLRERGIAAPATESAGDYIWNGAPVFLKQRRGVGSVGAELVQSKIRWAQLLAQIDPDEWVVQPPLSSPEITVDCFYDGKRVRALPRERVETKAGVSVKARLFEDKDLSALAESVCESLELLGSSCFQVMTGDGGWQITDINPRPGAGTRLAAAVGVNFQAAAYAFWTKEADPWELLPKLSSERRVARVYQEVITQ